jgi:hypothetical protein
MTDYDDDRITGVMELLYRMVIGAMIGMFCGMLLSRPSSYNSGVEHGRLDVRSAGCAGACVRRDTEMSHVHELMCVCQDGQTLTLDYGAMYRPMGQ